MIASSPTSAPWSKQYDSWNGGSAPASFGSWNSGRAPPAVDQWRDHRWDEEWSAYLPQWGSQSVPNQMWDGTVSVEWSHKTTVLVDHQAAFGVAGWGTSRLAPQVHSKWGEPRAMQHVSEAKASCPIQEHSGPLPSVGSAGHADGTCKRCAFFPKGRCKNGADCTHCHFDHPKPLRSRRRKRCAKGMEMEEFLWDMSGAEEDKKDEEVDDVSTQAGETLTSPSADAESGGKASQPDEDEQCNGHGALDDDDDAAEVLSDAEESEGSSGADEEEEVMTQTTTTCSKSAPDASETVVVSADSWAARQRLRQMDRERSGTSGAIMEIADVEQCSSKSMCAADSSQHEKSPPKVFESSPSSWAAQLRIRRAERDENSPEDITRKAKSVLNKLTQERFESLCQQILDLPVHTAEQLAALVAEIFDKATTEKGFLSLYTELCARLDAHLLAQGSCVGGKVFRKALVTECQASFERNLQQPLDPETLVDLTYEERYVEEVKHKTRTLGNMRFIGELLIRKLLAGKILFFIVNEMLDTNSEASLESLVELLTVVSPTLERKGTIYEAPLRETFGTLRQKSKDMTISMRLRCKISDLLDLRSAGWAGKASDMMTGEKISKGAPVKC